MQGCENKYTTLLDLSRQAKIITGETACFDGKIQAGIPFSGYPSGVDVTTAGVISTYSSQAVLSGSSGTTLFDVSNPTGPNYIPSFGVAPYNEIMWTGNTYADNLFTIHTSGMTLPITPLSADSQTVGIFWYPSLTGYNGTHIITTQFTGYSVTYSFQQMVGDTIAFPPFYSGVTGYCSALLTTYTAGTLDYQGPLDYLSSKEDITADGTVITNKLRVTGGASATTIGYVLTQVDEYGTAEWVFNSASAATNTFVASGLLNGSAELELTYNTGGSVPPIDLSSLLFTGNTSGDCINELWVDTISGCSDTITIGPNIQSATSSAGNSNNFVFATNSTIQNGNDNAIIIGGNTNRISILGPGNATNSAIVGGGNNLINVGGLNSAIVGGQDNVIESTVRRSVILGGDSLSATTDETVYVPKFNINEAANDNTLTQVLVLNNNGDVKYRDASSFTFSGGSGNCITDLYVTNIYGCSPVTVNDDLIITANVGIGVTSPTTPLHISGSSDQQILVESSTGNAFLKLISDPSDNSYIDFEETTGNRWIMGGHGGDGDKFKWATGATFATGTLMTLTKDGELGIGTTSPTEKIQLEGGNILVTNDVNDIASVAIKNFDNGGSSRSSFNAVVRGENGIDASGVFSMFSSGYTISDPDFGGKYLPNSLTIATGGGGDADRAHVNIGTRRTDGQIRFFTGDQDYNDNTLLGIWDPTGLTLSGDSHTFHLNTNTFQVRNGANSGYVLTSDVNGNASWQPSSGTFTGNTSGDCIQELWVSNISGCTGEDLHIGVQGGQDIYIDNPSGTSSNPHLYINDKGQIGIGTNDPFSWATNDGTGIEIANQAGINDQIPLAFTEAGTKRFFFETDFAGVSNQPVHIYGSGSYLLMTFYTTTAPRIGWGTTTPVGTLHLSRPGNVADQTKYPTETNLVINNTSTGYSGGTGTVNKSAFRFDHLTSEKPGALISSNRIPAWDSGNYSTTLEFWNSSGETLEKRIEIEPSWNTNIYGDITVKYGGILFTDLNANFGPWVRVSGGTTDLIQIGVTQDSAQGLTIGTRGETEPTYDGYGKQGDGFLYSSAEQNGLNIISANGTGTEDYIKFYGGTQANTTASMTIIGSGATKGYIGIGLEIPTEKLHVDGSIRMVDGNEGVGKILTSDADGVGTWEDPAGVTIDPYFSATTAGVWTWNVSGQSTNYEITLVVDANQLDLTNVRNGDYGTIIIHQDSTGGRDISFGNINGAAATHYVVNGGNGVPTLTANGGAIDILSFTYNGTSAFWTVGNDYT